MGKVTGFLEFQRLEEAHQEPGQRKKHYREFILRLTEEEAKVQGARCMDCGTPFCMSGCPVNNIIPDFNDLVYKQDWQRAIETLHSTNNFPEFTGRICPAPCEEACVLRINDDPVGIKSIEHAIIDKAFEEGWVKPQPPAHKTGKKVAVVGSGGAEQSRDLPVPGRELDGVYFAMEFLPLQNKRVAGDKGVPDLWATDKHVVVIGGGDTGSDCVGTSNRHGAKSVTQFELLPMPPDPELNPVWPYWPTRLRTSSSQEEGVNRDWSIATKEFVGENGKVKALRTVRLEWKDGKMSEVPGSEAMLPADLVLLALGFVSPAPAVLEAFGVEKDLRGNAKATTDGKASYVTSVPKIFAAGDIRRGQSLVVWAIREGRQCARAVDEFLMGFSECPREATIAPPAEFAPLFVNI